MLYSLFVRFLMSIVTIVCLYEKALAEVSFKIRHSGIALSILAEFDDCEIGKPIKLYIPGEIWGADYRRQIKNIEVIDGTFNEVEESAITNTSKLRIKYDIVNLPHNVIVETFGDEYYHFCSQNYMFLMGHGFVIYPDHMKFKEKVRIYINSEVLQLAFNIPPYLYKECIETDIRGLHRLVIVGDKAIAYKYDKDANVKTMLPITIKSKFFEQLHKMVVETIKKEQEFFDNRFVETKVIMFIPAPFTDRNENNNHRGGTVIGNSTVIFVNHDESEVDDLLSLIRHESIHFWIGSKGYINGPTWFREGLTDYLVDKIHFADDDKLRLKNYNTALSKYFIAMVDDIPDPVIDYTFFKYHLTGELPYLRGYLIFGQVDSILDLRDPLRSIVKYALNANERVEFTPTLLFEHSAIDKVSQQKIRKLLDHLTVDNFNKEFLDAKLNRKTVYIDQIPNFSNIIKSGFLDSKFIKDKSYIDDKYLIHDIRRDHSNGDITIEIQLDDYSHVKVPLDTFKVFAEIPYYK